MNLVAVCHSAHDRQPECPQCLSQNNQIDSKVDVIHNQLTSPDVTHRDSYPNIEGMSSTNIFLRITERNQKICFRQSVVRTILNDLCREYVRIGATGGDLFPKQGQHLL